MEDLNREIERFWNRIHGKNIFFITVRDEVEKKIKEFEESDKYCMAFDDNRDAIDLLTEDETVERFKIENYDSIEPPIKNLYELRLYELCKVYKMAGREMSTVSKIIERKGF